MKQEAEAEAGEEKEEAEVAEAADTLIVVKGQRTSKESLGSCKPLYSRGHDLEMDPA